MPTPAAKGCLRSEGSEQGGHLVSIGGVHLHNGGADRLDLQDLFGVVSALKARPVRVTLDGERQVGGRHVVRVLVVVHRHEQLERTTVTCTTVTWTTSHGPR